MSDLLYLCFLAWHDVPVACSHSEIEVHATFFCQLIWLGVLTISSSRVFLLHDYCGQGQIYCWTTLCSSKLFYSLTPWAKIFFSAIGLLTNAAWLHYGLTSIGGFWYQLDRPLGFHIARTCTSVFCHILCTMHGHRVQFFEPAGACFDGWWSWQGIDIAFVGASIARSAGWKGEHTSPVEHRCAGGRVQPLNH